MIRVSAGVIRNAAGQILVCRRGEGRANAHLWEFPGGKQEAGEDAFDCLRRELAEELSLPVERLRLIAVREWGGIRFSFIEGVTDRLPVRTEHEAALFAEPRAMLRLSFCPADAGIARQLAMAEPRLRAVLWDFDGTLFDTYPMMTGALARACLSFGIREEAEGLLPLMKVSLRHALERLSDRHGIAIGDLAEAYRREEEKTGPSAYSLMPGAEHALSALRSLGCMHYLVTHRGRRAVDALAARGLAGLFTDFVTSELGFPRKPDPASVRYLLEKHGLDAQTACMVGDRPLDVEAGQRAGAVGCLYDPQHLFDGEPCDLRTDDLLQLPELLFPPALD